MSDTSKNKVARSEHRVSMGPCPVPLVPYSHFSRFPPGIDVHAVWKIIGPTVQRNMDKPMWLQFCAVYIEGLNHAAGVLNGDV